MIIHNCIRHLRVVSLAAVLVALVLLSGCGKGPDAAVEPAPLESTHKTDTAQAYLEVARSAVATSLPDAKLLVVQTGAPVSASEKAEWSYLFGSPSTGTTHLVYVSDGQVVEAAEYGESDLSEKDWAQVPETSAWKIDSDEAYRKAAQAAGVGDPQMTYMMGMQTYYTDEDAAAQEASALTWYVYFNPFSEESVAVAVDAQTGEAAVE